MKKLAIMFVMLLGSVATMQAQYFNFTCIPQAENAFTADQQDMLVDTFTGEDAGSLNPDGGLYSIPSSVFLSVDISGIGNNMFYVIDNDGYFERTFEGLQAAVDYVSGVTLSQAPGIPLIHSDYLIGNGIPYALIPAQNGCGSCVAKMRFQGGFTDSNGHDRVFIMAAGAPGAMYQLHNSDGSTNGFGPYNYSITGEGVTTEYFLNIDNATARAAELNTRFIQS